jgi:hypothetical protein
MVAKVTAVAAVNRHPLNRWFRLHFSLDKIIV